MNCYKSLSSASLVLKQESSQYTGRGPVLFKIQSDLANGVLALLTLTVTYYSVVIPHKTELL